MVVGQSMLVRPKCIVWVMYAGQVSNGGRTRHVGQTKVYWLGEVCWSGE